MSEVPGQRGRKRVYDADRTRTLILDAAETLFAEHGFAGVAVDKIAAQAGYNKSLIFQYFGDKLGLYTAVIKRADRAMDELLARVLAPLLADPTIVLDAPAFRGFLEALISTFFDYLVEQPHFMRILLWEQATGWQTYTQIAAQITPTHQAQFDALFQQAHAAGLLRTSFAPLLQISLVLQICLAYLSFVPLHQAVLSEPETLSTAAAHSRAKAYLVPFIVHGMMSDPPAAQSS